jgi:hypothetical protein
LPVTGMLIARESAPVPDLRPFCGYGLAGRPFRLAARSGTGGGAVGRRRSLNSCQGGVDRNWLSVILHDD